MSDTLDKNLLISALAFLAMHHQKQMDEATRDANNERVLPDWRKGARGFAKHHQEQLYQIGEQLALLGGRNAYPRPEE